MKHHARTLWPSISDLANWIAINCAHCRWRDEKPPFLHKRPYCPLPDHAPDALESNRILRAPYPAAIFGPRYHNAPSDYTTAPKHCAARKDRRGRPPKAERTP